MVGSRFINPPPNTIRNSWWCTPSYGLFIDMDLPSVILVAEYTRWILDIDVVVLIWVRVILVQMDAKTVWLHAAHPCSNHHAVFVQGRAQFEDKIDSWNLGKQKQSKSDLFVAVLEARSLHLANSCLIAAAFEKGVLATSQNTLSKPIVPCLIGGFKHVFIRLILLGWSSNQTYIDPLQIPFQSPGTCLESSWGLDTS